MCGRYTLIADLGDLAQRFEFDGSDFSYDPGYNSSSHRVGSDGQERRGSGGGVHAVGVDTVLGPRTRRSGHG